MWNGTGQIWTRHLTNLCVHSCCRRNVAYRWMEQEHGPIFVDPIMSKAEATLWLKGSLS